MSTPPVNDAGSRPEVQPAVERSDADGSRDFFDELRHRKVYQTTVIYAAAAWAVIQFADIVAPRLGMPDWSINLILWVLITAFPVVIILSWVFEIKSHGWSSLPHGVTRFFTSVRFVMMWIVIFILAVVLTALFFGGLPQKSFALMAKDSVVLGQFQNYTANSLLDDSLELAFRIGFEQSRHAFVIPQSQIDKTMSQMVVAPGSAVDREIGVQIALREGAKALIIGSIGEVGTTYKLTAEVVDPSDGRTVLVESATVQDADGIIEAMDKLTRDLRAQLGESVTAIAATTIELERVTTANLEALRAYSLGIRAAGLGDLHDAVTLFERAISLDPQFSMAHAKIATLYASALENPQKAAAHRDLALQYRDRLTERERVYVEASHTESGKPAEMIRAWRLMRTLFPQEAVGHHNLATAYWRFENDFASAAESFGDAAAIINPWQHISYHYLGYVQLGLGAFDEALGNLERAWQAASFPIDGGLADAYIVVGNYDEARDFLETAREVPDQKLQFEIDHKWMDLFIDQGKFQQASEVAEIAIQRAREFQKPRLEYRAVAARLAIMEITADAGVFSDALQAHVNQELALLEEHASSPDFTAIDHLLILGKISARNGHHELAEAILTRIKPMTENSGFFFREAYTTILAGEIALAQGATDEAITLFLDVVPDRPLFQAHESLARAYESNGDLVAAAAEYEWISENRGLPFAEVFADFYGKEFSILDWALADYHHGRLNELIGDKATARESYERFVDHWRAADDGHPLVLAAQERISRLGE